MTTPFQQRADARRAKSLAEVEAAKKTLEDATTVGAGFWVSYIFLMFYIAVSAGAVTHSDLLREEGVKLPFLNLDLPLLGFYFLAPILFIVMHMFTLSKLVMLAEKAKRFLRALEKLPTPQAREKLRQSLPSNIFVQFMAGPTEISGGGFGGLLRLMGWITMAIAPVVLLLFVQVQFLPYHSFLLNQEQRMLLFVDLFLIWWLWGRALQTPMIAPPVDPVIEVEGWRKIRQNLVALWQALALPMGVAASLAALIFSSHVASFPMEWKRPPLAFAPRLEEMRASLTEWVFGTEKVFSRWPYNTLQLEEFNIFEVLKLDDANKLGGRDFTIRLRERRLEGANFTRAKLGKADLREAKLQGATLADAQLQGATLTFAQLQGATLDRAKLQGATLSGAQLQGATLTDAKLQGATLNSAKLQGASLDRAELQGATLDNAELQGATLKRAKMLGASLKGASLQGASLDSAMLLGAELNNANLQSIDLANALVWRADLRGVSIKNIYSEGINLNAPSTNEIGDQIPWNNSVFENVKHHLTETIPNENSRDKALKRIERLKCKSDSNKGKENCGFNEINMAFKGITEEAYKNALSEMLKSQICNRNEDSIQILRGLIRKKLKANMNNLLIGFIAFLMPLDIFDRSRVEDLENYAPQFIEDIQSYDCPVSTALTVEDKARLLEIKQAAEKDFPPKTAPAKPAQAK